MPQRRERTNTAPPTLARDLARYRSQLQPAQVARLAERLGLTAEALRRLRIGRASAAEVERHFPRKRPGPAWTFPAQTPDGSICGLRIRTEAGAKFGRYRAGLILPVSTVPCDWVAIVEGETDAAAALDLGLRVIGLPGCRSCWSMLPAAIGDRLAVIILDVDRPGQRAAEDLAKRLGRERITTKIIVPPTTVKDLRGWVKAGLTRFELSDAIDHAEMHAPPRVTNTPLTRWHRWWKRALKNRRTRQKRQPRARRQSA